MNNDICQNFEQHFRCLADDVIDITVVDEWTLHVRLNDGSSVIYDDMLHTIRSLPSDSNSMSEQECRQEFGYRLRKMLLHKGVSQRDLCTRTGIADAQLSCYMNGKHTPSLYVVDKIAKALDCSIDDFTYRYD